MAIKYLSLLLSRTQVIRKRRFGFFSRKFGVQPLLVDANAPLAAQDTLKWKVTAVRLLTDDYELTATSREANSWAFVATLFLIALSAYCSVRVKHFTKAKR
ncbi:MAG: hypothetical protein LBF67_06960 [Prevotellaceae bacterium]|nr:hypothetical protein [Prevotellaceae bacterium]